LKRAILINDTAHYHQVVPNVAVVNDRLIVFYDTYIKKLLCDIIVGFFLFRHTRLRELLILNLSITFNNYTLFILFGVLLIY
jgi:hypothetical protein